MRSFARPLAVCTVLALSLGSIVATSSAASADTTATPVADLATLDTLLAAGGDVVLAADISGTDTTLNLTKDGSATIDLGGHTLTVQGEGYNPGILVPDGAHLTIKDTAGEGVLNATGGKQAAGIGSGWGVDVNQDFPGLVEISSGTVNATAGIWGQAAGIGGSGWSSGPAVTITGGDVTATAGYAGAGIGSGYNRHSAAILISGGNVTANAGEGATAIGGPRQGTNKSTTISGGYVTLNGNGASVLGYGLDTGANAGVFGTVSLTGGRVYIPEGSFLEIPADVTVANSSEIINYGSVTGAGAISNTGAITGNGQVTARVSGYDYFVNYDARGGQVDAASVPVRAATFSQAGRSLPVPTHLTLPFTGWNTKANGTGEAIDPLTDLSWVAGVATTSPISLNLYAMYGSKPTLETEELAAATRGVPYSDQLVASGTGAIGFSVVSGELPTGLALNPTTGTITGTPTKADAFEFVIAAHNEGGADTTDYAIGVLREAKALTLVAPKGPVAVGTTTTVSVSGLDAGENYTVSNGAAVLASGTANSAGKASPKISVLAGPEGARALELLGSTDTRVGNAALKVVAAKKKFSVTTNKKTYHYGQKVTITVKKLAVGEKVSISFRGKTITSSKAVASSKGTYSIKYSVGSSKGTKTIKVTGAAKTRAGSVSLKVKK